MDETTESKDKRLLMIELSCKDQKCNPCTYPDCQRYVKLNQKPKFNVKRFEVENPSMKDDERQWIMFVELSCKDKKCNPCTYPNCQRFKRGVKAKKTFKVKSTELKDTGEAKQVVEGETS